MKSRTLRWFGAMTLFFGLAIPIRLASAQVAYTVTDLGTFGGTLVFPFDLNNRSDVVGTASLPADSVLRAFLWRGGVMSDLGTLGGANSDAVAINQYGQITGAAETGLSVTFSSQCFDPQQQCHAFLWDHGVMKDLGTLPGGESSGAAWINSSGRVVGASDITTSVNPLNGVPDYHAFLWENGEMKDLGTLGGPASVAQNSNDSGQVVGNSQFNSDINPDYGRPDFHAFLWDNGKMVDLNAGGGLGGAEGEAVYINSKRQIVGFATLPGEASFHAFLWENGVMSDMGTLPGDVFSFASTIDNQGRVVGYSATEDFSAMSAVLWKNGVITDLNTLIPADSDFYLLGATSINPRGEITGNGVRLSTGELHGFLLSPIPGSNASAAHSSESKGAVKPKVPENVRRVLQRVWPKVPIIQSRGNPDRPN
jgi:probable HAF family extracellular repeat protein